MKTYIDYPEKQFVKYYDDNNVVTTISKTSPHFDNIQKEIENGEAELVPYTPPAPTWGDIRVKRNELLTASDWTVLPDVTLDNKQAWLDYRQALRDITITFDTPSNVVWPVKP